MPRWLPLLAPYLLLCVLTFGLLLPLCCHRLVYSYYYMRPLFLQSDSEAALEQSLRRGQHALAVWQDAAAAAMGHSPPRLPEETDLLVTVVTARREEAKDSHYLLQVALQLQSLLSSCGPAPCASVLICDVESGRVPHEDAALLSAMFPVVRRSTVEEEEKKEEEEEEKKKVNMFEKEKQDYVFCLQRGAALTAARHTVVLEDDAVPHSDFFSVVRNLVSRRFALSSLYVKLYHPERLQRYLNPEPWRLTEWAGLGALCACAFLLTPSLCSRRFALTRRNLLFFTFFFMAAAELAGRHYLLELRRASPQLYAVSPATECCTPALLFPGNTSQRAAAVLQAASCSKGNAKDHVLFRASGRHAHSLEPNAVRHIGAFSSVRPNPATPLLL